MESAMQEKLEKFLHRKKILKELRRLASEGKKSLVIEFDKLLRSNKELAECLLEEPGEFLEAADSILMEITKIPNSHLRVKNLEQSVKIRDIRAEQVGKFIQVEGVLTRASDVKPEVKEAVFKCLRCGEETRVLQTERVFRQPLACENPECLSKGPFKLVIESSEFRDWQSLRIQERPEELRGGRIPRFLDGITRDDFVDKAVPGNRVAITGILRAFQEGLGQKQRKTTFRKILFVNHIEVLHKGVEEEELSPEDEKEIKELAKDQWLRNRIIRSIAPSIYGYEPIKEAIALQLFSSSAVRLPDDTRIRGDTHILLTGDPGTAKSQLLKWVAQIAPRGLYTSGKKATGAGLCVAHDSLIWVRNGLVTISDLVENHFGGKPVSKITSINVEAIPQFGRRSNVVTSLWKIPSPPKMIEIRVQYGNRIEVTPETKVMTETGWKEAKELTSGENVVLPINYGKWGSSYPGIVRFYPSNLLIKNRAKIFKKISSKIGDKRALAKILGIPEDKLYYRWLHDDVRGAMKLGELRKICKHFKINIDEVLDGQELKCQLRYGVYFNLPTKISPELAYFVGLIAGDGSLSQKKQKMGSTVIKFSNNDLREEYVGLVRKLFGKKVGITPPSQNRAQDLRFGNHVVFCLLKGLGVQKPKRLFIPREITHNKELVLAYLRGLFDTDGSVCDRKSHRNSTRGQIELVTIYRRFAEQIQNILFRLGIPAYLVEKKSKTSVRYDGSLIKSKRQYRIYITQNAAIDRFAELIGFTVQRKKEKLQKIVGRKKVHQYSNFVLAKIKKVRSVFSRHGYVYDMTVEGLHSFIANGILVHNTAAAVRDELGGGWALEAGVLAIADGGLASIDEFDKMNPEESSAILESMEQQTISVAKAGIVATLNTRTAILAAANPELGRFDEYRRLPEQINLPPVILSRFDLIFIMRDEPLEDKDHHIAQHMLMLHYKPEEIVKPPLDVETLRKIIIYARKYIEPKFKDKKPMNVIEDFFVQWRKVAERGAIPISPRQLEALIRLAKANARLRLSGGVTVEDANRAIKLVKLSLQQAGIDPETGEVDIDVIMTGQSRSQREKFEKVLEIIRGLEEDYGGAAPIDEVKRMAATEGIKERFVENMIEREKMRGRLYEPKQGMIKRAVG